MADGETTKSRRFKPDLIESTSTSASSSRSGSTSPPPTKPRRFAPEPVETSARSLRTLKEDRKQDDRSRHGAAPEDQNPHIETPKARRRFAPEPVETTSTRRRQKDKIESSTDDHDGDDERLLPHERVTSPEATTSKPPARRKFAPQLIESASRTRRAGDEGPKLTSGDKTNLAPGAANVPTLRVKLPRPSPTPLPPSNTPTTSELEVPTLKPGAPYRQGSIKPHYNTRANTRQHSYRVPSLPSIDSSQSDRSDTPSLEAAGAHVADDSDTSDDAYKDATRMRESVDDRFSGYLLALAAKQAEKQLREQEAEAFINTTYHEPVAHYMNRSDSEESVKPTATPKSRKARSRPGRQDSDDEAAALKEMQRHGEKVYKSKASKGKTAAFNWDFDPETSKQDVWQNAGGQFGPPRDSNKPPRELIGGKQQDPGLRQMRKAASPPMLGGDIDFPRCPSPDNARFDVTQGADYLRRNVCYTNEESEGKCNNKLWAAKSPAPTTDKKKEKSGAGKGIWGGGNANQASRPTSPAQPKQSAPRTPGGGLWGGFCNKADQKIPQGPTGLITPIQTPRSEKDDPFAAMFKSQLPSNKTSYTNLSSLSNGNGPMGARPGSPQTRTSRNSQHQHLRVDAPPSPPRSKSPPNPSSQDSLTNDLDTRLALEKRINAEFSDAFVTQVFNYLSLGYPSIARQFDTELSHISKVPVSELREDDKLAEARGYVRLGPTNIGGFAEPHYGPHENGELDAAAGTAILVDGEKQEVVEENMCKRWRALRRYVREWGRQMISKEVEGVEWGVDPLRAWGLPARRGSWGL